MWPQELENKQPGASWNICSWNSILHRSMGQIIKTAAVLHDSPTMTIGKKKLDVHKFAYTSDSILRQLVELEPYPF